MRVFPPVVLVAVLALAGCSSEEKKPAAPRSAPSDEAFIHEEFTRTVDKLFDKVQTATFAKSPARVGWYPITVKNELRGAFSQEDYTQELVKRLAASDKLTLVALAEGQKPKAGEVDYLLKGRITESGKTKKIALDVWDPASGESAATAMTTLRIERSE